MSTEDNKALVRRFVDEIFVAGQLEAIDELVAEGDLVVARVTSSGTPTADFMGVPASDKRYTIGEMHLFRMRHGRVVEHWHQQDALGLMRQLGALPG
jgi:predicted ester cyclase